MDDVIVLDGGMGKHLDRTGAPFRQPEWSALALMEAPEAVRRAHVDFIESGADVVIANTYAVVPFHIGEQRFSDRGAELARLAGQLAREAVDASGRPVRVAGSLPPLFGSYEPDLFRPDDAPRLYDVLVAAQAPFVDLWIGETVSSIREAEAIMAAVDRHDSNAELWMSFTVPDELESGELQADPASDVVALRSGESIAAATDSVADRVHAILFNCSPPEVIDAALRSLHEAVEGRPHAPRTGAYANAFVPKIDGYAANEVVLGRRDDLTPEAYRDRCVDWVERGASIVGGCCHMFPEHIEAIAAALR